MSELRGGSPSHVPPQVMGTEVVPAVASDPRVVRMKDALRKGGGREEQAVSIPFILTALRRWWRVAAPVALLLAAGGGTLVRLFFCEPTYEANAWFRIEGNAPFVAFQPRSDESSKAFFETQVELIRSPLVLGPAVARPEIGGLPRLAKIGDKIGWLSKQVRVTSLGDSELFTICFSDRQPKDAAAVVNAITEAYFALRDASEGERRQRVLQLLEKEKEKRGEEVCRLREELRSLAEHVKDRDITAPRSDADYAAKRPAGDLQGQLVAAQVERAVLEARIQATEEGLKSQTQRNVPTAGDAAPGGQKGLSKLEAGLKDATVDRQIAESEAVKQQLALILAKQVRLRDIEKVASAGKRDPVYAQLQAEIAQDQQTLDKLRQDLRPSLRKKRN